MHRKSLSNHVPKDHADLLDHLVVPLALPSFAQPALRGGAPPGGAAAGSAGAAGDGVAGDAVPWVGPWVLGMVGI